MARPRAGWANLSAAQRERYKRWGVNRRVYESTSQSAKELMRRAQGHQEEYGVHKTAHTVYSRVHRTGRRGKVISYTTKTRVDEQWRTHIRKGGEPRPEDVMSILKRHPTLQKSTTGKAFVRFGASGTALIRERSTNSPAELGTHTLSRMYTREVSDVEAQLQRAIATGSWDPVAFANQQVPIDGGDWISIDYFFLEQSRT